MRPRDGRAARGRSRAGAPALLGAGLGAGLVLVLVPLLGSCGSDPEPEPVADTATGGEDDEALVPLPPGRLLRRASLDLTGRLPGVAALEAIEADPSRWEAERDALLDDALLEEQLVQHLAERWLTLRDEYDIYYYDYDLDETEEYAWLRGVGQEPLRIMARVIVEDRSWAEVVTGDFTVVDARLAGLWPVEGYDPEGAPWQAVRWTDGRPEVGVLASNGLWWTYPSDSFNQNRTRAAAMSRLLLCEDLLSRPVEIENAADLLQSESTSDMVRSEPSCLSCHATIEPLAASMYGFLWLADNAVGEYERYHPERELAGPEELGVEMAYWGTPVTGLAEVGWAMSGDPRLYQCTVRTFAELLLRRSLQIEEQPVLTELEAAFLDARLTVRPLLRAITELPEYQAGELGPGATEAQVARERLSRTLSPWQVAGAVEQLTGFRWTFEGADLLDYDPTGFRIMAGGVDGQNQAQPHADPTVGGSLVYLRLAQAASQAALAAAEEGSGMLAGHDLTVAPTSAELDALALQAWGRRLDASEQEGLLALWQGLEQEAGAELAWAGLVEALLRHPDFLTR